MIKMFGLSHADYSGSLDKERTRNNLNILPCGQKVLGIRYSVTDILKEYVFH